MLNMDEINTKIEMLEASVKKLIHYCNELSQENQNYKSNQQQLMVERSELQSKNDKVRSQVQGMVDRLKALDKTS